MIDLPPGAANPLLEARERARRVRELIRQITDRRPLFRGVLYAQRRDLGELATLTGVDGNNVFVHMDGLDQNVADLLHYASGGTHDAHATAVPAAMLKEDA